MATHARWTIRRKAALLEQIRSGELSEEGAIRANVLTSEELREWWRRYGDGGLEGLARLRVTKPLTRPGRGAQTRL